METFLFNDNANTYRTLHHYWQAYKLAKHPARSGSWRTTGSRTPKTVGTWRWTTTSRSTTRRRRKSCSPAPISAKGNNAAERWGAGLAPPVTPQSANDRRPGFSSSCFRDVREIPPAAFHVPAVPATETAPAHGVDLPTFRGRGPGPAFPTGRRIWSCGRKPGPLRVRPGVGRPDTPARRGCPHIPEDCARRGTWYLGVRSWFLNKGARQRASCWPPGAFFRLLARRSVSFFA